MTPMNKSISMVVAAGILMTMFLVFTACDSLNHEANQITKLTERITKLEEQAMQWKDANTRLQREKTELAAKYNNLVTVNRVLIAERDAAFHEVVELRGHVTSLNGIIENDTVKRNRYVIPFKNGQLYNKAASRKVAAEIAQIVRANPVSKITIKGYSSHNGSAELNMKLSKDRANGVKDKIHESWNDGPLHINMVAFGESSDNERKVVVIVESIP